MDERPAVNWHEGMFLRPHHFQAADRYWADQLHQASRLDRWFNWGVRRIDLDPDALKNYRFVARSLQARLRDGTVVRVPQDTAVRELDLRGPLAEQERVEVMLAVPPLQVGRANVGKPGDADARFRVDAPRDGVADEATGQNARPVQFRRLNLTLLASGAGFDPAGYETLTLATVGRSGQGAGPQLVREAVPPVLACDAWPPFREDLLQPIYHRVAALMRDLGETVREGQIGFSEADPDARRMFEQVRLLNEAVAVCRALARTDGLHPVTAYAELNRLLGQLAIFGPRRVFPELEHDYEHDAPGPCFYELKRHIDEMLRWIGADRKFQQRAFVGKGLQMQVEMDEPWLAPGWQMFVAAEANLPPAEVVALLTAGATNMKIASSDRVEQAYALGHRGLGFRHEPQPPRVLPSPSNVSYFSVDTSNKEEWAFVLRTRRVAVRLNERLLDGDLEGKKVVTFRGPAGKQPQLRVTLFVVPPKG
jgi:type VI secretion system protein ImpJ